MSESPMTDAEVHKWIDACNHEPARQVLRDYLRLRTALPSGGEVVGRVSGEFQEVWQDGETYWLQTVLLDRPHQLPFGSAVYTAAPSAPADCIKAVSAIEDALDRAEVPHKDRNGRWLTLVERVNGLIAQPPSAPVGVEWDKAIDAIVDAHEAGSWDGEFIGSMPAARKAIAHVFAQQPAAAGVRCGDERYELDAYLWRRESTQEWVLELSGAINDTSFTNRFPVPLSYAPEDAVSLPDYERRVSEQPAAVDGATLRQALHAMKRCQRESGGSQWAPWIAKVEAALAAQPGGSDNDR